MAGLPSVAWEAGWSDDSVEAVAVRRRARSVPGAALSMTPRDHRELPQLVLRNPQARRTWRALRAAKSSTWRLALPLLKGRGTALLSTDATSFQVEPSEEAWTR